MATSRTENVKRNIYYGVLQKFVTLALPFITRTLLLYFIGTTSVGISTLFTSVLSFLSLAELGFGSAVVYHMYKPIAENDVAQINALLKYYKKIYQIIGIAILVSGLCFIPLLPNVINGETPAGINIYYLYLIYLIRSASSYFIGAYRQSLLSGYQRIDVRDKISMAVTAAVRIGEVAVIVSTKNLYLFAVVDLIGTIISNFLVAGVTKRMYPEIHCEGEISEEIKNEIKKKIGGLFGTKLNSTVVHQADTIVISGFLGLTALAQYGNYYYILNLVLHSVNLIFNSMTASIGNKIATSTREQIYRLFRKLSFMNYWIVGWFTVCLVCLYQPFMTMWVGESLLLSDSTALLMGLYFFFQQIQRTILVFKDANGLWYEDRYRPYVSMILNLVVNILLVQIIGINGVIISTIVAFFVSLPWCNYTVFKKMFDEKPSKNLFRMAYILFVTVLAGIPTYWLCSLLPMGILSFIVKMIICTILPNLIFYLMLHRWSEFNETKKIFIREINKMGNNAMVKLFKKIIRKIFKKKKNKSDYDNRFEKYAFTDGKCKNEEQYEASITRLYHTIEKGLSYENYRAGFGKANIDNLLVSMEQYAKKYNTEEFFYQTALDCLWKYVEKNKDYGVSDPELENRINQLPGKRNNCGGIIEIEKTDAKNMDYCTLMKSRHSIRHFSDVPVDIETIKEALEIAQYTPSACNRQGWNTHIISDKKEISSILENQNGNRGFGEEIDKLLVVTANLNYFQKSREHYQPFIDGGMYAESILNSLFYMGVGAIPLSASLSTDQDKKVRNIAGILDNEELILFIGVGNYPEGKTKTAASKRHEARIK